jgi:hypothetical protein
MYPVYGMGWQYSGREMSVVTALTPDKTIKLYASGGDFTGDNFTLMQFTGVLDGRGREIYEGDILRWRWDGAVGVVTWSELVNGWAYMIDGYSLALFSVQLSDSEVIGNRYQNPELVPYRETAGEEE